MTKRAFPAGGARLAFLISLLLSACGPAASPVPPSPVVRTVEATWVVTQLVTREVTRIQEVQVTNTPTTTPDWTSTPSPTLTLTKIPTATPTWEPPRIEVLAAAGTERTACWYGPATAYLYKYGLPKGVWMRVIGRNEDGSWVLIKAGDDPDSNACWIQSNLAKFLSGGIADVPVFWLALPYSVLYGPPKAISTNRVGNEVTIFWQPIWMTEDDYRGYLVEAWVCQGGRQVFKAVKYETSYIDNQVMIGDKGIIAVMVVDEPGCEVPSRVRLYAVEKHGYTNYVMVPWPAAESAAP